MTESRIFMPGSFANFEIPHSAVIKSSTYIRGCKEGHYIILDHPLEKNDVQVMLQNDMPCIVRFLYQGKIYAFESRIMEIVKVPFPFIFTTYPEKLESINLRSTDRYPIQLSASFHLEGMENENNSPGTLLDLSETGCLLRTDHPQKTETLLSLTFSLPNGESIKDLSVCVKRVSRNDVAFLLGLQFMGKEDRGIEKISKYLSHLKDLQINSYNF